MLCCLTLSDSQGLTLSTPGWLFVSSPEAHLALLDPAADEDAEEAGHQDAEAEGQDREPRHLHLRQLVPELSYQLRLVPVSWMCHHCLMIVSWICVTNVSWMLSAISSSYLSSGLSVVVVVVAGALLVLVFLVVEDAVEAATVTSATGGRAGGCCGGG